MRDGIHPCMTGVCVPCNSQLESIRVMIKACLERVSACPEGIIMQIACSSLVSFMKAVAAFIAPVTKKPHHSPLFRLMHLLTFSSLIQVIGRKNNVL